MIHLEPRKHDPFVSSTDARVSAEDFIETTFELPLDPKGRLSKFRHGQSVGMIVPIYNDIEIDEFLMPTNITNPFTAIQKQKVYEAMRIPILSDTLKFSNMVCMGRVVDFRHRSDAQKEAIRVDYNQVMPTQRLSGYKGQITGLKTALMATYDHQYGWQRELVKSRMDSMVADKRVDSTLAQSLVS